MSRTLVYVASLATTPDRDSGWIREFSRVGWTVVPFRAMPEWRANLPARVRRRLNVGREVDALNGALEQTVRKNKADWVHFRLPLEFHRRTIERLRGGGALVTEYFNDNPFARRGVPLLHRRFKAAIRAYDAHFVYRPTNVVQFRGAGAAHVEHCPPAYDPHRHVPPAEPLLHGADAAFVGHWEDDWRTACLEALYREGFRVVIKGGGWTARLSKTRLRDLGPIDHAFGGDYNRVYASAAAGLCFFSKLNEDEWTERGLEIIAVGGVLVCERTREALELFRDGDEAVFFSSIPELITAVRTLASDPCRREAIRRAGHRRLLEGRHSISDRADQVAAFADAALRRRSAKAIAT